MIIYYTDWHNVDEDSITIMYHGGGWSFDIQAGVAYRDTDETPTTAYDFVVFVQKKINRTYSPKGDACSIDERQLDYAICLRMIHPLEYLLYSNILPPGRRILPKAEPSFAALIISTACCGVKLSPHLHLKLKSG